MAPEGVAELRDWLFLLMLCLTLLAEVLEVAAATGYDEEEDLVCPSVCRCDEDFIYCNDRGLSSIPPLPLSATVLYLQNNHIDNAGLPTSLERHLTVLVVYLYDNELDDFPMHLPPSLRELHLQDNNIRTLPRATLARMPLLEKLHLDDNSVSTVSIEDKAFVDNPRLRLLFLSRNHLSSIPSGLPASLEELRLDDNRISTIPTHAFRGLSSLRRLVLDGNLLANQRIADDTFSRLSNLTELSLVRNSLLTPPVNLPSAHLQRLSLQDNALIHMPRGSLDGMRRLQRLDLSGNNLTTLPRGLFKDLDSLGQLLVRGNPWHCGCNLRWLHDWLHARGNSITVRGLTCQAPEKVRDMALKDLTSQMEECEVTGVVPAGAGAGATGSGTRDRVGGVGGVAASSTTLSPPQGSLFTLRSKRPGLGLPDSGLDYTLGSSGVGKSLALNVKPLAHDSIRVTWSVAQPTSSFRLSWLRLGTSAAMGSITETLVRGDRREYLLTSLHPRSSYIICMVPLATSSGGKGAMTAGDTDSDEAPVCAKAETSDPSQPDVGQEDNQDPEHMATLPLAGIIGGATVIVSLALIFAIFCWYGHRAGRLSSRDQYSRGSSRKSKHYDDYIESGTKKDTTILEIRGPGFQMTPMVTHQPPKPLREDYIIHTIFPSNGTGLYKGAHQVSNAGYGTNRGYRERGIPDIDYCYT
ncbi:leucine-rich repeat transmembrane protein FLRT1 [Salmo salar]|uniref:Leucine-rich repeat transmembrane protein FLRT1-like n=1 Tax=Salmo salar TaxID=8030 RepID=A0A1S3RHT4_SALSA|nr:leucine-rich repeat transmembrane protein FLRT1-like [Salmo salar]XP_014051874.1 leucine-rich repeat transmembrane protein FLRT1-like [Salmo salar]|eukprot:XP_014051871.1 PREDICTED: leucine-rich repeat transmembrane protein FLRT1-like [Salmo salar]